MGKKLSAKEVIELSEKDVFFGFDICHKCEGVEPKNSMQYTTDDIDCEDLICGECAEKEEAEKEPLKLKEYVVDVLRESYSSKKIRVTAFTEEEAESKAAEEAGGLEFTEQSADYSIVDLEEIIVVDK
jgi:hypothetical protein